VKLWFDEDLSPTLVQVVNERGFEATCNRDRGVLGHTDHELRRLVQSQGFVFVTDNASDFVAMYKREDAHPGLAVMPGEVGRERQQELVRELLDWIADAAATAGQSPGQFMVNRLVEIDRDGACATADLP
jgi:predicted nuclease of predicted toxin-antitoxin system